MARGLRERSVLPPAGDPGEDQPRVDGLALGRPDAEALTGAGAETVKQHISFRGQREQRGRVGLHVQVDDPLAAVQQVDVLGRHGQTAGATDPHHVGAEVGQHHGGVRPGADPAEFDHLDTGQWPRIRHPATLAHGSTRLNPGARQPFLFFAMNFFSPSVAVSAPPLTLRFNRNPGIGTTGSTVISNFTLVLLPAGVSV